MFRKAFIVTVMYRTFYKTLPRSSAFVNCKLLLSVIKEERRQTRVYILDNRKAFDCYCQVRKEDRLQTRVYILDNIKAFEYYCQVRKDKGICFG